MLEKGAREYAKERYHVWHEECKAMQYMNIILIFVITNIYPNEFSFIQPLKSLLFLFQSSISHLKGVASTCYFPTLTAVFTTNSLLFITI